MRKEFGIRHKPEQEAGAGGREKTNMPEGSPEINRKITEPTIENKGKFDVKSDAYEPPRDGSLAENVFIIEPDERISKINGEMINVHDLIKKAVDGDEEAVTTLVTPRGVLQGEQTVEEVLSKRDIERRDRTKRGEFLKILDIQSTFEVSMDHPDVRFFVEPADYDAKEKKFVPNWKLRSLDTNGEFGSDQELLGKLKINKRFEDAFDLSSPQNDQEGTSYRNITLKRRKTR